MCAVQQRPTDIVTEDFLYLGLPVVEFAFELSSGAYGPYFGLGIIDSAEVQKSMQMAQLRNAQSGTSKLVRELVRQFDATLQVGTFRHSGENMQLMFASASLADVSAGTVSVTDDTFTLTTDDQDFHDLANQLVDEPITAVEAAPIVGEEVATATGSPFGETTGDYSLDYKINVIGDIDTYYHDGVDVTTLGFTLVAGTTPLTTEIAIDNGATGTSGEITYFTGEAPAAGVVITCDYTPSFSFVEGTHFVVDYKAGRVRILSHDQAADFAKDGQTLQADYDYSEADHQLIKPYSQFIFAGRARVRMLTDVGANLIWTIPKAQIRLTEDAFVFNRDDFTVSTLAVQLLEDTTSPTDPYGSMEIYREGTF